MDLYLLKLTSYVLGKKAGTVRLLGSSFVGAAGYCLVLCIPGLPYELGVLTGLLPIGMLMIKLSCQTRGCKELLYGTGYLFTFSFLMGGFILFLKGRLPWLKRHETSLWLLAGIGWLGFWGIQRGIAFLKKKKEMHFCQVEVSGDEGKVSFQALVDTGNGLREPISQKPVAILEEKEWQNLTRWKRAEKYRVIPFHSIGKENGLLEGYEIDEIEVKGDTGRVRYEKVIVAVSRHKLSGQGTYQMILPPELSI